MVKGYGPALVIVLAATGVVGGIGGCASLSPPERPVHDAPDRVGEVDPARLIGLWRVTPLNPYPDQGEQETVIEYRADGTVLGQVEPRDAEATAVFGDTRFEMSGRWSVVDGRVVHEGIEVEARSESGNPVARMMSEMMNGVTRDIDGAADIRELDDDRIVMLGTDGAAVRYDRVR